MINLGMENSEVKEAAVKYNYFTIEDYLEVERTSQENKYELHEGYLVTMQGASLNHVRIATALTAKIWHHLANPAMFFPATLKSVFFRKNRLFTPIFPSFANHLSFTISIKMCCSTLRLLLKCSVPPPKNTTGAINIFITVKWSRFANTSSWIHPVFTFIRPVNKTTDNG
jgi:hypothetical protein